MRLGLSGFLWVSRKGVERCGEGNYPYVSALLLRYNEIVRLTFLCTHIKMGETSVLGP